MARYHCCSRFPRYWYEHHLRLRGFEIKELTPNGDWYALLRQEITRLGGLERAATGHGRWLTSTGIWGCSISNYASTNVLQTWLALAGSVWR